MVESREGGGFDDNEGESAEIWTVETGLCVKSTAAESDSLKEAFVMMGLT